MLLTYAEQQLLLMHKCHSGLFTKLRHARQNARLRFVMTVDKPRCPEDFAMLLQ